MEQPSTSDDPAIRAAREAMRGELGRIRQERPDRDFGALEKAAEKAFRHLHEPDRALPPDVRATVVHVEYQAASASLSEHDKALLIDVLEAAELAWIEASG